MKRLCLLLNLAAAIGLVAPHAGAAAPPALEEAAKAHGFARSHAKSRRGDPQKQLRHARQCVSILKAAFKKSPSLRTGKANGHTGAEMLSDCKAWAKDARPKVKKIRAHNAKEFQESFEYPSSEYERLNQQIAEAKAVLDSKKKYSGSHAWNLYNYAVRDAGFLVDDLEYKVKDLGKGKVSFAGKKRSGKQIEKLANTLLSEASKGLSAADAAANKEKNDFSGDIKKTLKGDRLKIFKQRGVPVSWDGVTDPDPQVRIKTASKSSFWYYDDAGCAVTYKFSGSKKTGTDYDPPYCK